MTYELEKELKDAGFPSGKDFEDTYEEFRDWVPPSLSELIEACGDGFDSLYKDRSDRLWHASMVVKELPAGGHESQYVRGQTPEEAVARLWLALNQK